MTAAALALAGLAAVGHVGIFWLESIAWMRPATRRLFGIASEDDARVTRALAFNQGFYNLFLAVVTAVGIAFTAVGSASTGVPLIYAGCGSMVAAAVVLVATSRRYARAALAQGLVPAAAVALLVGASLAG